MDEQEFQRQLKALYNWNWQLRFLLALKGYPGLLEKADDQKVYSVPKEIWEIAAWSAAVICRVCVLQEEYGKKQWLVDPEYWKKALQFALSESIRG